ncbi:MAG: sensor histidine kinase [Oscillospiraceae bacterium]|jgi:signal transduction histidine kinase
MGFFRNPEVKKECYLYLLCNTIVLIAGAAAKGLILAILACALFDILYILLTYRRYRKIRMFSAEINQLFHGGKQIDFQRYQEGEMSILQNEVQKMAFHMQEQAETLLRDRRHLKDSLADISHQIKTPMTSIHLILSFLGKPEMTEDRRRELVQELEGLARKIDWLVSALLMLSKLDAGVAEFQKKRVFVAQLIEKAVEPISIAMELRGISIEVRCEKQICFLGDFEWSVEAIGNIVKNCMEHTPSGGEIAVAAVENELYTEIIIKDTGPGIAPEDLPHLFERFYRGKHAAGQSVGIGLSLSRRIVVEQNGTLKAENRPNGGAQFTIRFYKQII